jgi:multidrug efflux pump subunit AcrB
VVYFPILALTGIEGKMFKPMAITVIFALVGALALALTLMPALCSYLLGGNIKEKDSFLVKAAKKAYRPFLVLAALAASAGSSSARRWLCFAWRSSCSPDWARSSCRNSTKARSPRT